MIRLCELFNKINQPLLRAASYTTSSMLQRISALVFDKIINQTKYPIENSSSSYSAGKDSYQTDQKIRPQIKNSEVKAAYVGLKSFENFKKDELPDFEVFKKEIEKTFHVSATPASKEFERIQQSYEFYCKSSYNGYKQAFISGNPHTML